MLYLRLRAPGAATASEIADFMQRNPDWPAQAMLERRRQEAIASDPDDAAVLAQCNPAADTVLGDAAVCRGDRQCRADGRGQRAGASGLGQRHRSATGEAVFLRRWGGIATAEDQWARFQRLAWLSDPADAARQITRLDGGHHAAAEARLAAKRDDPQTEALVAALPPGMRDDPGLTLDRARAFRHADRAADAAALLTKSRDSGEPAAFWAERNLLARKLLHDGDPKTAYAVVAAHGQIADEQRADAEFPRGLHRAADAA